MEMTRLKCGDDNDSVPKTEKDDEMPPDEHRCCHAAGKTWRCKSFRMNHGGGGAAADSVPKTKFCEKHYYGRFPYKKRQLMKTSGNGETRALKRGKKVTEEDETGGIQQTTSDGTADAIEEKGSAKFGTKKKNVKRTQRSGELKSLTKPVVETRASKRRKMAMEGDLLLDETTDTIIECGSANIRRKRKNVKRKKRSGELKSLTRAKNKIKCLELSLELERKKLECTKLQGKLAEVEETRNIAETERTPADATASWEKMFSYLESRFQGKDNGNSTMGCVESCISNLESLFLRMESKHSTMAGCVESRISKLELSSGDGE
ncbi:uncharacterized protein LOC113332405 isoform X2 [Papaver somniferum]|uniref:uncharacterized protein LOC113332405 isoform X2 n=1 Tax=Papaver somniferum TaxID=3469 RepID=UPI000E6FC105|nr:uncharacterized protein LOC113332405 isoform X2 [Papaver somniferum]